MLLKLNGSSNPQTDDPSLHGSGFAKSCFLACRLRRVDSFKPELMMGQHAFPCLAQPILLDFCFYFLEMKRHCYSGLWSAIHEADSQFRSTASTRSPPPRQLKEEERGRWASRGRCLGERVHGEFQKETIVSLRLTDATTELRMPFRFRFTKPFLYLPHPFFVRLMIQYVYIANDNIRICIFIIISKFFWIMLEQ